MSKYYYRKPGTGFPVFLKLVKTNELGYTSYDKNDYKHCKFK